MSLFVHHEGEDVADLGGIIQPSASCPACTVLVNTENMLIKTLMQALSHTAFRDAYVASPGLCIPHLRMAFATSSTLEAFATVRDHAIRAEETLLAQLAEIIRKHDYRYQHEPTGAEKGAAARAVAHVAGTQGVTKLQIV